MDVENLDNGKLKYTYKLKPGISKIEGAVEILKDMNYPSEIIENIEQY
jgi:DNA mismatch repair ATPase MutS